jgi:hypothetical protein
MKATLYLRRQHRNLEQSIALLNDVFDLSGDDFDALASDLTAHLEAEESVLYPAAQEARVDGLAAHRAVHARVRAAVVEAASRAHDAPAFRESLAGLRAAFDQHARLEERGVHASLEGALSEAHLEALGQRVASFRSAAADSLKVPGGA